MAAAKWPPLRLLKTTPLAIWHRLSDGKLEAASADRNGFRRRRRSCRNRTGGATHSPCWFPNRADGPVGVRSCHRTIGGQKWTDAQEQSQRNADLVGQYSARRQCVLGGAGPPHHRATSQSAHHRRPGSAFIEPVEIANTNPHGARMLRVMLANAVTRLAQAPRAATYLPRQLAEASLA